MATAAARPSGGQQNGSSFYDALPEVGDIINNLWTGFGQASGNNATTAGSRSKSKSKSRDSRSMSRRRRHKSKSKSKARSVRSRSRGAPASSRSRGRSKTKKVDRPPRHPSSVRSTKNLPGPDNFAPAAFDLSAVVALDQRREQKNKGKKQGGRSIAGSKKSSRSTGMSSKRSAKSNRSKSAKGGGDGGSEVSRSKKAKTKKTHRSQSTVDTHRTGKSTGTARSNRSTRSNKSSTSAKPSSKSIKSTRSGRSTRPSTSGHADSMNRLDIQKQRRHHRKGISKSSHKSGKSSRAAPTRMESSTVSMGSTKIPTTSSITSERRAQMETAAAALAECRDDAVNDEEYLLGKVRDDSSDDDSSSSDDDSDSSSSDDDNDNAAEDADDESDTETNISRAIRSIGIPIGNNFDEGSNDCRSKRSARSRRSKANSTKSKANKSRRQSSSNVAEPAGLYSAAITTSKKARASDSCDSSSEIDESEFYQGKGGDVLGNKYRVVDELGKGTFGRVMKAYEIKEDSIKEKLGLGNFRGVVRPKRSGVVAIKVTRNVAKYKRDAEIEANLLRKVNRSGSRGTTFFPQLIDEFESPMGHHCVVLEKLGMSLYEVLKSNHHQPFSSESVRAIAIQLFDALDHMHGIGLIHTDLKPENILLASNNCDSADMRIKLIDLGSAEYERNANRHSIVNTRQYRAPEILLRIGWSFPSDVWAAGCTLAELALGSLLFPAKEDVEHLALIERTMGVFPRWMLLTASTVPDSVSANSFSPVQGTHKMGAVLKADSLKYVMKKRSLAEQLAEVSDDTDDDCISVADALNEILCIDPMFRPTSRLAKELCMDIGEAHEAGDNEGMKKKRSKED